MCQTGKRRVTDKNGKKVSFFEIKGFTPVSVSRAVGGSVARRYRKVSTRVVFGFGLGIELPSSTPFFSWLFVSDVRHRHQWCRHRLVLRLLSVVPKKEGRGWGTRGVGTSGNRPLSRDGPSTGSRSQDGPGLGVSRTKPTDDVKGDRQSPVPSWRGTGGTYGSKVRFEGKRVDRRLGSTTYH